MGKVSYVDVNGPGDLVAKRRTSMDETCLYVVIEYMRIPLFSPLM